MPEAWAASMAMVLSVIVMPLPGVSASCLPARLVFVAAMAVWAAAMPSSMLFRASWVITSSDSHVFLLYAILICDLINV